MADDKVKAETLAKNAAKAAAKTGTTFPQLCDRILSLATFDAGVAR